MESAAQILNEGARQAEIRYAHRRFARMHRRGNASGIVGAQGKRIKPPVAGLTHWWDARRVTLSGTTVAAWPDLIGGLTLTAQGTNLTYLSNDPIFGGFPSIATDGATMRLESAAAVAFTQPYTVYAVMYYPSYVAAVGALICDSSSNTFPIEINRLVNNRIDSTCAGTPVVFGSTSFGQANLVAATANGASSNLYVNSSTVGVVTGGAAGNATGRVCVFATNAGAAYWPNGGKLGMLAIKLGTADVAATVSGMMSGYAQLTRNTWS